MAINSNGESHITPKHRTVEVEEYHLLDSNGLPARHYTRQYIEALAPLDRFPYKFDTSDASVEVTQGGQASGLYEVEDPIFGVDIILDQPLDTGERAWITYMTHFNYQEPPVPEFRRAVGKRVIERLGITVVFSALKVPKQAIWAEWNGYGEDSLVIPESKELAKFHPVNDDPIANIETHRTFNNIQGHVFGLYWEWS